jgi:hypothetical protein
MQTAGLQVIVGLNLVVEWSEVNTAVYAKYLGH